MSHGSSSVPARFRNGLAQVVVVAGPVVFLLLASAVSVRTAPTAAHEPGSLFAAVDSSFPEQRPWRPALPLSPPDGSAEPAFDNFDNFWTLAPIEGQAERRIMILPAQDRSKWIEPKELGINPARWAWIEPDEHGFLWIAAAEKLLRIDPRFPERGGREFTNEPEFPAGRITAMAPGPNGSIVVALDAGKLVELDRLADGGQSAPGDRTVIRVVDGPKDVRRIRADGTGALWLSSPPRVWRSTAPLFRPSGTASAPSAEPPSSRLGAHWEIVARMPGSNHDLSGDVLDGKLYIGGGLTNGWGFPAKDHPFSRLFEFNARTSAWRVAGDLGYARVYCATSHLGGKVWVIGGDVFEKDGSRRAVDTVQIIDPATGQVTAGPSLSIPRPMPVAAHVDGRIYVAGNPRDRYDEPGRLESIGPNETQWREEPHGPRGFGPLAACGMEGRFYVAVPEKSLAAFDVKSRSWSNIDVPHPPRSCQMASLQGELWLMGGVGVPGWSHVQIYNPKSGAWRSGPALPRELAWGAAAEIDGQLYVTGGAGRHGTDWSYNNRTWLLRK